MLLHFLFCLSAQPNSLGVRPIRCYHISFALPKQIEPNKSFVYLVFGLDHFDPPVLILFHRGLQQVPVCLCKHCCCGYFRGANFHEREDFQVFAISSPSLGQFTRQYKGECRHETSHEKREEVYKDAVDCPFVIFSVLRAFVANSGMNPFVYAWRLKNFRKAFKSILTCRAFLRRLRSVSVNLQLSTVRTVNNTVSRDGSIGRVNPTVQE